MSDISIHFSTLDWVVAALFFGWPGLILGGAVGALAWKQRRIYGGVIGAIAGCLICAGARFFML